MMRFLSWIALPLAVLLAGCGTNDNEGIKAHEQPIVLQQQWFANSGFAGEVWAQEYLAKPLGVSLTIHPGSDSIETTQVVKSGQADFGVAGADQIMLANENGADLVVVGVINPETLAAFISNANKGILLPSDFVGKRVGTMEGTPVHLVYRVMMNQNKISIDHSKEVPTNWSYSGFDKDYDIYPAFINDEPITFATEKPSLKLSIMKPSDFGVNFIGTVYFCRRDLIESNPKKVQMFVNLMIAGWQQALSDPKKATAVLKSFSNDINQGKELKSLIAGIAYYRGSSGKILYATKDRWLRMADQLKAAGLLKTFDYDKTVNNNFVEAYYEKK
jgi:NitT/TauT family transport system substrate-binding protein